MRKTTVSHDGVASVGVKPGSRQDRHHTRRGRRTLRKAKAGMTPPKQANAFLNPGSTAATAMALGYQQGSYGPGK